MKSGFNTCKEYLNRLEKGKTFSLIRNGRPYQYYGVERYNNQDVFLYRYGRNFYRMPWVKGFKKLVWIA